MELHWLKEEESKVFNKGDMQRDLPVWLWTTLANFGVGL